MEASILPPLAASLSQRPREPGHVKMMPPPRSSPITVDLPSTMYRPNSGPPLAPISLLPVQDTTGYITDRRLLPSPGLAKDGRPLPPILTYLVRWTDAPAARNLVPVKEILDYVSPAAVEEFERKFEAELDDQRARKEAEKVERRRLKAATAVAGAPLQVPKGKKGNKKRGRPPKHKPNDIAPITAETEEEDVSHKKFRPGSMSLSTPKKARAMTISVNEEMKDGTETPLEYAEEYDELAGEPGNYLYDMEIEDDRLASANTSTLRESAVNANGPEGPGGIEDDDESDSDDENYLGLEDRKLESMSYEPTPLYESEDEVLISIEDNNLGVGRMNIDTEIERRQSRNQEQQSIGAVHDASDSLRYQSENSWHPAKAEKQAHQSGQQGMPRRTPSKHIMREDPFKGAVKECEKTEKWKSPGHERGPIPKLVKSFDHKPVMSTTPIPLPVVPGMKKAKPKETPVPLPFLPGMQRSAASSAATTPVQTPSHGWIKRPQAKPASCSALPSLRPPSFSSQRSGLHRWITETPVPPPVVPRTTAIKTEPQQLPPDGWDLRAYVPSTLLGTSNGNRDISASGSLIATSSTHSGANVNNTTDVNSGEMTKFGYEETVSASPAASPTTAHLAPRKRKRRSTRGLAPIEKDEDGEEFWEVRVIIDHKDEVDEEDELLSRQYLVVWEGDWPLTWESEENFVDKAPVTQYWNRRIDRKRAVFRRYRPKGRMIGTSSRFYGEKAMKIETADNISESHIEVRSTRDTSIEDDDTPEKRRRSSRMTKTLKMELADSDCEDEFGRASEPQSDHASVDHDHEEADQARQRRQPSPLPEAEPVPPANRGPPSTGFRAVNAIKATLGWPFGVASG